MKNFRQSVFYSNKSSNYPLSALAASEIQVSVRLLTLKISQLVR